MILIHMIELGGKLGCVWGSNRGGSRCWGVVQVRVESSSGCAVCRSCWTTESYSLERSVTLFAYSCLHCKTHYDASSADASPATSLYLSAFYTTHHPQRRYGIVGASTLHVTLASAKINLQLGLVTESD